MKHIIQHVPNALTISRFFLGLGFIAILANSIHSGFVDTSLFGWAFSIYILALFTDVIDGPIARKYNATSAFGRMMDPLADKCMIIGGFMVLAMDGIEQTGVAWWMVGVIIARELFVTILRSITESMGNVFSATWAGKVKMALQSVCLGVIILVAGYFSEERIASIIRDVLIWITVLFTAGSMLIYWPRILAVGKMFREK